MSEAFYERFARGDFSSLVPKFQNAGFDVTQPLPGVLQISRNTQEVDSSRLRLLISVGVHGDETAPIELMAQLLEKMSNEPHALAVDLMVMVGNIAAIMQAKRFIDVDLNRLFVPQRTQFNDTSEGRRADQMMHIVSGFFQGHSNKWHLDLHTAIRASFYPTFAIVPGPHSPKFVHWLGCAGIDAAVLNPQASVTFSSYTCVHHGAVSCTAELGRIGELGKNDLKQFEATSNAIDNLLRGSSEKDAQVSAGPLVFQVAQELIKRSDAFRLTFDSKTENFTEFPPGAVIATDGDLIYSVGAQPEFVLFPNQDVRVGLRAGLMVVKVN